MATAIVTLPDGRRAKVSGATREEVMVAVQNLSQPQSDPNDPDDMAGLRRMAFGPSQPSTHTPRRPVTLPFGLGEFSVGGGAADLANAASSVPLETSLPIVAATIGSVAGGPVGGTAARSLAMRAATSAPVRQTVGAAVGGAAAGGALEAQTDDATVGSIARRAATTGGQMAAAELAGLGIAKAAGALVAPAASIPALKALDPLSKPRQAMASFARDLPDRTRAAARRVQEMLPEGVAANAEQAAARIRSAATEASEVVTRLARESVDAVPDVTRTASELRGALGDRAARLGADVADSAPAQFISRVIEKADDATLRRLRRRLGPEGYQNALSVHLSELIQRASKPAEQGGQAVRLPLGRRAQQVGDELVEVDVAALDRAWERSGGLYIGRGGQGATPAKLQGAADDIAAGRATAPELSVDHRGVAQFVDGRHRTASIRDSGAQTMTVAIPRGELENARRAGLIAETPRTLDPARLLEEWKKLPRAVRDGYPKATRQAIQNLSTFGRALQRLGRFANTSIGGEIVESAATPLIAAAFGMHVAVPLVIAKALLNPGPLTRYLTRDTLPPEVARIVADQVSRSAIRGQQEIPGE